MTAESRYLPRRPESRRTTGYEPVGRVGFSMLGILVFACGMTSTTVVNWGGELYVAELALPLVALACALTGLKQRGRDIALLAVPGARTLLIAFVASLVVTLLGYMLSDIIRVTRPDQYLRGWARVGFVLTDFLSLAVITARDRRLLWWFGFGFGLGAIVFLAAVKHAPLSQWKIGYGEPSLLVLMALCAFLPARISSILLAGFALVSIFLDYRSLGALSLVSAGYLWIRARRPQEALAGVGPMFKILLAGGLVLAAISYGLSLSEDKEAATRRVDSNAGRKAAIEVGLIGIAQSPIIGYGSWTENKELAEMFLKRMREYGGDKQYLAHAGVLFLPHSQVLQAWLEGGILGTAFFLFLIYQLIRSGRWMILLRPLDRLTPFMLNFLLSGAWGIFMSPFGSLRISLALLAVIVFILKVESAVAKKSLN